MYKHFDTLALTSANHVYVTNKIWFDVIPVLFVNALISWPVTWTRLQALVTVRSVFLSGQLSESQSIYSQKIYSLYTKVCGHRFKLEDSAISAIPIADRCMKSSTLPCYLHTQNEVYIEIISQDRCGSTWLACTESWPQPHRTPLGWIGTPTSSQA